MRRCFASLFLDRAIRYRVNNGFDHFKVLLSVGVMKMVRADLASSVIFTLDTETGFRDVVFVTGAYGLGENVVQGTVDPDEFYGLGIDSISLNPDSVLGAVGRIAAAEAAPEARRGEAA